MFGQITEEFSVDVLQVLCDECFPKDVTKNIDNVKAYLRKYFASVSNPKCVLCWNPKTRIIDRMEMKDVKTRYFGRTVYAKVWQEYEIIKGKPEIQQCNISDVFKYVENFTEYKQCNKSDKPMYYKENGVKFINTYQIGDKPMIKKFKTVKNKHKIILMNILTHIFTKICNCNPEKFRVLHDALMYAILGKPSKKGVHFYSGMQIFELLNAFRTNIIGFGDSLVLKNIQITKKQMPQLIDRKFLLFKNTNIYTDTNIRNIKSAISNSSR